MFERYHNNLWWQLDPLGQEKLTLEVELGNMQGLVDDSKISSRRRSKSMQTWSMNVS